MPRGRKKNINNRKGYFYEEQEQAVIDFNSAETTEERNKIYENILRPALTKMIESIIRRYKLYPPDEEYQTTFDDTMSFLISKIEKYKPESGFKAYSYCGTICKNYLIYKINSFKKSQERNLPYDTLPPSYENNEKFTTETIFNEDNLVTSLIKNICAKIQKIIDKKDEYKLKENEIKVGYSLIYLFENWEDIFDSMGSNKFNKSTILLFLKEMTSLETKDIRESMKKYKTAYYDIKKTLLNEYL